MTRRSKIFLWLILILIIVLVLAGVLTRFLLNGKNSQAEHFDGEQAYTHVLNQLAFGPRIPGSEAHAEVVNYIQEELINYGWEVEIQNAQGLGHPIKNIIARRGSSEDWVILGAHYDSRFVADNDPNPENRTQAVPGANDGASGVAVLLELARVLPEDYAKEIWLVFFDLEDQGRIEGWDWILGSQAFADSLEGTPDAVIIVDMIGDADLNIYREKNSYAPLVDEIWQTAASLGYEEYFIDSEKFSMLDDHTPFLSKGMKAIDIIDFDYPYWHTLEDTADKVSSESLDMVGEVILNWLRR